MSQHAAYLQNMKCDSVDTGSRYRHTLVFDGSVRLETRQMMVEESSDQPVKENFVDKLMLMVTWERVKTWIKQCEDKHATCNDQFTDLKVPKDLLLIDIQRKKLVQKDPQSRYIALSYVWGKNPTGEIATSFTKKDLMKDGGIIFSKLSPTIRDAIKACQELGEQYLWVDRLCIVQDDEVGKQHQINSMHKIFGTAKLVLVVTHGDMNNGIPGIRPAADGVQGGTIDGVTFLNSPMDPEHVLLDSPWLTRAWTHQEAIFSKRSLFFTPLGVFFKCPGPNHDYTFGITDGPANLNRLHLYDTVDALRQDTLINWGNHLEGYSQRHLSHASDIYNAFSGISHALYPEDDSMLFGLPRIDFDEALHWDFETKRGLKTWIRRPLKIAKVLLPSWSWASVEGPVSMRTIKSDWDLSVIREHITLTEWSYQEEVPNSGCCKGENLKWESVYPNRRDEMQYKPENQNLARCLEAENEFQEDENEWREEPGEASTPGETEVLNILYGKSVQMQFAVAWRQGCIEADWPFRNLGDDFAKLAITMDSRYPSLINMRSEVLLQYGNSSVNLSPCVKDDEEELMALGMYGEFHRGILRGRGQTASFAAKLQTDRGPYGEHVVLNVLNKQNTKTVGVVSSIEPMFSADTLLALRRKGTISCELLTLSLYDGSEKCKDLHDFNTDVSKGSRRSQFKRDLGDPPSPYELFGSDYVSRQRLKPLFGPKGLDWTFFDREAHSVGIPVVGVMVIAWNGPIAHRIGIGWVLLTAWVKAKRAFKTIYLE
ncbi:uncharacterized protein K452DRAFT_46579 [Aplosporella prunicola CBS 121167]|uniref:Heterokaryon incompatibility domain-containing protein n=1 Tax=Aplosporella prunicola CBS 121167 TaxID=1176127 RepID=A0A6A6B8Z7_9PEZI|nr:uncharacterized protein K452DRAFT_46579 [Aplosporella prunicola CBS 121167]KAF2140436.1 hypothetical protein K452DRAFT_46579 [Aplosporella prunicola CBS 121167]